MSTAVGLNQSLFALFTIFGPVLGTFVYTQLGVQASIIALFIIFMTAAIITLACTLLTVRQKLDISMNKENI